MLLGGVDVDPRRAMHHHVTVDDQRLGDVEVGEIAVGQIDPARLEAPARGFGKHSPAEHPGPPGHEQPHAPTSA